MPNSCRASSSCRFFTIFYQSLLNFVQILQKLHQSIVHKRLSTVFQLLNSRNTQMLMIISKKGEGDNERSLIRRKRRTLAAVTTAWSWTGSVSWSERGEPSACRSDGQVEGAADPEPTCQTKKTKTRREQCHLCNSCRPSQSWR